MPRQHGPKLATTAKDIDCRPIGRTQCLGMLQLYGRVNLARGSPDKLGAMQIRLPACPTLDFGTAAARPIPPPFRLYSRYTVATLLSRHVGIARESQRVSLVAPNLHWAHKV